MRIWKSYRKKNLIIFCTLEISLNIFPAVQFTLSSHSFLSVHLFSLSSFIMRMYEWVNCSARVFDMVNLCVAASEGSECKSNYHWLNLNVPSEHCKLWIILWVLIQSFKCIIDIGAWHSNRLRFNYHCNRAVSECELFYVAYVSGDKRCFYRNRLLSITCVIAWRSGFSRARLRTFE